MKRYIYLLLSVLLLISADALAQRYEYSSRSAPEDFFSGKDTLILDIQTRMLHGNHGGQHLQRCSEKEYACFRAPSMLFSVPKKTGLSVGQKWESDGQVFTILREERISALGQSHEVKVISSRRSAYRTDYFYYSEKCGLIAIKFVDVSSKNPYIRFLLLEGQTGFPY